MEKVIYILKHPQKGFTGMWGPIGFENGRGSTSSRGDRDILVEKLGCEDITEEYWAKKKKEQEKS